MDILLPLRWIRHPIIYGSLLKEKIYLRYIHPYKARKIISRIRRTEQIKTLFILTDISIWKTESLYNEMLKHKRFQPIIGIALSIDSSASQNAICYNQIVQYLNKKGYKYIELVANTIEHINPDIIFYSKPYKMIVNPLLFYDKHPNILLCHIQYSFYTTLFDWEYNTPIGLHSHFSFYENKIVLDDAKTISKIKAKNGIVTGTPIMDELLMHKDIYPDPWKPQEKKKAKIIWAPHHSIGNNDERLLNYSTFIENADKMVMIAKKYNDVAQFTFKPHPLLYKNLVQVWGKKRTDSYYELWDTMPNSQTCTSDYVGLFLHSDALIHDCSSFIIDYLFTGNPVMYLIGENSTHEQLNKFALQAFNLHDKGHNIKEIEYFIESIVINGNDSKKKKRLAFKDNYLIPPHRKTASQNIINAILGVEDYQS